MKQLFTCCVIYFIQSVCFAGNSTGNYLSRCNEKLVDVVMEDLFTPPVASRVHVYPNIAAYEVLAIGNPQLVSLSGQIRHLPKLNLSKENINYSIAAEYAFTTVAKKLVFSEYMISDFEGEEKNLWKNSGCDTNFLNKSIEYGINAGQQIITWMLKDNYLQVKAMERYVINDSMGAWKPTGPTYNNAIEPHWNLMRTILMDSSSQFEPFSNCAYSENKTSVYYKNAYEVYQTVTTLDTNKKAIALFWDCNPNIAYSKGHITYLVHKISPGGHWIKISGQACRNLNFDEMKTAEIYTLVTIGLYESFLSCWTAKYKCNAVRPETYIQRVINPEWFPYIQTPPFPEYPSGHSVISSTAATILTQLIQQPYSFTDSSEMYIDLKPRTFGSFSEAAKEAGISRFYAGIHFMPSIINGLEQGKLIGNYIVKNLHSEK